MTKKRVIRIKYKEFLYETFKRMSFEDLLQYFKELYDYANDTEYYGGAPKYTLDGVSSRKADIIYEYLGENYRKEMNEYIDSTTDFDKFYGEKKQMNKCENCGTETNFTLNFCEECFDNAIDDYYSED